MRLGRFTRRATLRAGLAAVLASPFGYEAAVVAAATGATQELPAIGPAAGLAATLAVRRRPRRRWGAARVAAGVGLGFVTRLVWSVAPKQPAAVTPQRTWTGLNATPDGGGVGFVVNAGAGGPAVMDSGDPGGALRAGLPGAEVVVPDDDPGGLADELERLARSGVRALGIAGGDGSINTAAGVALRHHLPLVVAPAGTHNHLARDVGVETAGDTVDAVLAGTAIEVDVARIAGRPFLNTASFGSYAEIVDAREALEDRAGKWPALIVAVARVLRRGRPVRVEIDGEQHRLWTVFVGNCRYQPAGMAPTYRERLDDGLLDIRIADASHPFSRTRLVLAVLTGRLHRTHVYRSWQTTALHVTSLDGPLRLACDGETFDGPDAFDIAKSGDRLAIYAPHRAPVQRPPD